MAIAVELVMCSEMLRDPLATRVRDIVAPLVLVLASMSAVMRTLPAGRSAQWGARAALGALFLAVGVAVAGAGSFGANLRETGAPRGWQGIADRVGEIRARYAIPYERIGFRPDRMIEYLMTCTAPQSRILAIAVVQQLFFYINRGFAGGHDALSGFYTNDRQATRIPTLDEISQAIYAARRNAVGISAQDPMCTSCSSKPTGGSCGPRPVASLFWGDAWRQRCHDDLDRATDFLDQAVARIT